MKKWGCYITIISLLGFLACIGGISYAVSTANNYRLVAEIPVKPNTQVDTGPINVDPSEKVQLGFRLQLTSKRVRRGELDDEYVLQYRVPYEYVIRDENGYKIKQEKKFLVPDSEGFAEESDREVLSENVNKSGGTITVEHNLDEIEIDPPGNITINAQLSSDTKYRSEIKKSHVLVYDRISQSTFGILFSFFVFFISGGGLVIGLFVFFLGLIFGGDDESESTDTADERRRKTSDTTRHQETEEEPRQGEGEAGTAKKDQSDEEAATDQRESDTQETDSHGEQEGAGLAGEVEAAAESTSDSGDTSQEQTSAPDTGPTTSEPATDTTNIGREPTSEEDEEKSGDPVRDLLADLIGSGLSPDEIDQRFQSEYHGETLKTKAELKRVDGMEFETDFPDIEEGKKGVFKLTVDTGGGSRSCELKVSFPAGELEAYSPGDKVSFKGTVHQFDRLMDTLLMKNGSVET